MSNARRLFSLTWAGLRHHGVRSKYLLCPVGIHSSEDKVDEIFVSKSVFVRKIVAGT